MEADTMTADATEEVSEQRGRREPKPVTDLAGAVAAQKRAKKRFAKAEERFNAAEKEKAGARDELTEANGLVKKFYDELVEDDEA